MFQPVQYTAHAQVTQLSCYQLQTWLNPNLMDGVDTLDQTLTHQPSLLNHLVQQVATPNWSFLHQVINLNLTLHSKIASPMLFNQLQNQELEMLPKLLKWWRISSKAEAFNSWVISKLNSIVLVSANHHSSMLPN